MRVTYERIVQQRGDQQEDVQKEAWYDVDMIGIYGVMVYHGDGVFGSSSEAGVDHLTKAWPMAAFKIVSFEDFSCHTMSCEVHSNIYVKQAKLMLSKIVSSRTMRCCAILS